MSSIRDLIKQIAKSEFEENYGVPCTVKSIDMDSLTCVCSPINGDADFIGVRLQAEPADGILIIPALNSVVIVQPINNSTGYLSMYSKVDSIQWLDGTYGGIPKVIPLTEKINNLENQINNILQVLKTTSIPLAPSGTYPFAPLYSSINPLTPTNQNEIENTKIKHGDS